MMPVRRKGDGQPIKPHEAALEAWQLAHQQMLEAATKAFKSSGVLNDIKDADVQIAETPCDQVFQIDKVTVSRYHPLTDKQASVPPVLICYGLFGRQSMIDLQPDRSLVRNLLMAGIDVYVVDWGNPTRADQYLSFDDYVDVYLRSAVEFVMEENNGEPITLFGICEGGTFAAMLAALQPKLFAGLALAITPIDFHGDRENFWEGEGFLPQWIGNLDKTDVDLIIDTHGMLSGAATGAVFSALTPVASMTKYNLGLADMAGDKAALENFLHMEKWIADRPDHPGEAARQWLNDLYRENRLIKGTFTIEDRAVDLSEIACPVINIFALQDHIIPVSCSKALGAFLPHDQYHEIGFPGGHVGVFVSRKAQGVVADGLVSWMSEKLC